MAPKFYRASCRHLRCQYAGFNPEYTDLTVMVGWTSLGLRHGVWIEQPERKGDAWNAIT